MAIRCPQATFEDSVYHFVVTRFVLATLRRESRSLRVECSSKARIQRTKELLGAAAGFTIRHRDDPREAAKTAPLTSTGLTVCSVV